MTCKVKGILLKIGQTVHEEQVLHILCDPLGCIPVFAKSNRKKNQFDQFYYGEWVLYQTGRGNYLLNSFDLEESFPILRERIEDTFLASYFAQIVLYFGRSEEQETRLLLPLLLNGLYLLGRGRDALLVKSVFELKTMQLMGYCPTLASCGHPGTHFALEDGGVLCDACSLPKKTVALSASALAAIVHILNHPPAKAFGFSIPTGDLRLLSALSEQFLQYHLELRASALDLWKTVYEGNEK